MTQSILLLHTRAYRHLTRIVVTCLTRRVLNEPTNHLPIPLSKAAPCHFRELSICFIANKRLLSLNAPHTWTPTVHKSRPQTSKRDQGAHYLRQTLMHFLLWRCIIIPNRKTGHKQKSPGILRTFGAQIILSGYWLKRILSVFFWGEAVIPK